MNRYRLMVGIAIFALLLSAGAASAQTVTVISGNGQLICNNGCIGPTGNFTFQPLVVRLTDANNQPVANAQVNWAVTSGDQFGSLLSSSSTSDQNGVALGFFNPSFGLGQVATFFNAFEQSTIVASTGNSSATFTLTQGLQASALITGGNPIPPIFVRTADGGRDLVSASLLTGQVGSTATPPIKVAVVTTITNTPVPNVAVMLVNNPPTGGPTVLCATQAGAGTNTVLTDSTGVATCNPIFGGVPNIDGHASVFVGGAFPLEHLTDPTVPPTPFVVLPGTGELNVRVTPGVPGALRVISGNPQSAQAGQPLAAPLVVQLISQDGGPLAGLNINWRLSPANAGAFGSGNTTTVTDANGLTSNTILFNAAASGAVQAIATLSTDATKTVTFNLTAIPNITVTGLQVISGGGQTAIVNEGFPAPLVVQLNATGGAAANIPVQFSVSGPAIVSAGTVNTGSDGRAQVTARAGATPGAVTVTATANGFSQTFSLTVSPPGPTLLTSSFLNGADFQRGALSPCSIATIIATGLAPGLQNMVSGSVFGPLPFLLANDKVTVGGSAAPLFSVGLNANGQEQLTFQVPCNVTPGSSVPVLVNVGAGNGSINIPILAASPGVFLTLMSDNVVRAVLVRPDGSFVSLQNPARRGENLVAYLTGLGPSNPPLGTNSVAPPGSVVGPAGTVIVGMAGRGVPLISAQLSSDLVGLWEVTFTVPTDIPTGNNVSFSVSVIPAGGTSPISSAPTSMPVQ